MLLAVAGRRHQPLWPFHEAHTMDPPKVASAHFPMGRRGPGMGYDAHPQFPSTEATDNGTPDHAGPRKRCRKRTMTGPALDRLPALSIPPCRRVVTWADVETTRSGPNPGQYPTESEPVGYLSLGAVPAMPRAAVDFLGGQYSEDLNDMWIAMASQSRYKTGRLPLPRRGQ
jgi:hypothetical protein